MFHSSRRAIVDTRRHGDWYFAALVERHIINAAFGETSLLWPGWIYMPAVTVWVFLQPCLSPDHSRREAVARLWAWRTAQGWKPCSVSPLTASATDPTVSSSVALNDGPSFRNSSNDHDMNSSDWQRNEIEEFKCHSFLTPYMALGP